MNCKLFDSTYLDSFNVLPPPFYYSKDINFKFENFPAKIFCPFRTPKNKTTKNNSASIVAFVEALSFFDGFEIGKNESWVKLLRFMNIVPPDFRSKDQYLQSFVRCFELDEDSLTLDFKMLEYYAEILYSTLTSNIFQLFSIFTLKKIVLRNFEAFKGNFKGFVSFLGANRFPLVHLELQKIELCDSCELKRYIFFPNLKNINK